MEVTSKEQKRAEQLLQSQHIGLHQIKSFSFMKRYHQVPRKSNLAAKDKYGPGILTLHLKEGKEKVIYLPPFRHPSSVIRYLVSLEIPFDNYAPRERTVAEVPTETYQRPSLYMFWFFVLFLIFLILGYYSISGNVWWGFIPAIISFALSLFFISMLMTRFCYLTLDNNGLIIHSVGRTIRYPYQNLRKVNFDFAREQNFTHVMELLDNDYRYRLFYIGRVSRKKLKALMQLADKILIVTKQTEYAVKATNELIQNVNRNNSDKYIFLCNDFKKEEENALLLPTAAHRFTVSEYIEHLPAYEMKGSGLPVQTPGLQKAAFLIM